VLTAVRHGITVAELGALRFPNSERYLKSPAQMHELFASFPKAIANSLALAEQCSFSLDELRYEYPEELCPAGLTPTEYLEQLTWAGAAERYPDGVPEKVRDLLQRELRLVAELQYEPFFLTVWDIVRFARERKILCQGRGSAANSAVCYCLGITSVDPDRSDVLFERFVSKERNEPPDIDVDFEHERREEVLQYLFQKYGRERAALVAEVITYRARSAVRDVGKALGMSLDRVDHLAKVLDPGDEARFASRLRAAGLDPSSSQAVQLVRLAAELLGFPRHLSQHVGGMVIARGPLCELVPIENAAMPERTVIEWDKDDLDALGLLKVDCLCLGMLTAIRKCFDLVKQHHDKEYTLATIPPEDQVVYDQICEADTIGVFQIESRAQMSMLPRLKPRNFYDLVIEISIIRPGPIQGGMVHPYLRRRAGIEPIDFPDPAVEQVLHKTLGVPLFQEQVMRLAMVAAGFSAGEADQLRRAMGAWRRPGLIEHFRGRIREGMLARGLPMEFADRLFEQIKGFGEYGFPESHAASFALLAYASAWLHCYFPAAFAAAILNSQPMGFYAPAQIVYDARNHGVTVLPPDVNFSDWDCTLESSVVRSPWSVVKSVTDQAPTPFASCSGRATESSPPTTDYGPRTTDQPSLRLGFRLIGGFRETAAHAISAARAVGPFRSVTEFVRRTRVPRPLLARLAAADAFRSLGLHRRTALWQVLSLGEELPLFAGIDDDETLPNLDAATLANQILDDYDMIGMSLRAHPMTLIRPELDAMGGISTTAAINKTKDKTPARVAGLVLVRQRPSTAKGTIFMTIEDETGTANLVIWPRVWEKYRSIAAGAVAVLAAGKVERSDKVVHLVVASLEDVSQHLSGMASRSRDFR
jgi:error-prone DNA polymerase